MTETKNKPEQLFYKRIRKSLDAIPNFSHDRIENRVALSTPDISFTYGKDGNGFHGWMELKVYHKNHGLRHLTDSQKAWLSERDEKAGHTFVVIRYVDRIYCVPGKECKNIKGSMKEEDLASIPGTYKIDDINVLNSTHWIKWLKNQ